MIDHIVTERVSEVKGITMNRMAVMIAIQVLTLLGSAFASVPSQVSYQGRLTTPTGNPVPDGVYALKFSIYDMPVGGSQLWSTTGSVPLQVTDGLFSYSLGTLNPLPDSLAKFDSLWLGITVNLDPEISPRTRLSSSPYSFRALKADRADTAAHSLDKTIDAGELVIGTLPNDRYSAYSDLVAEGKIGTGGDQVAQGDHTHNFGEFAVRQDDSWFDAQITQSSGEILMNQMVISADQLGTMLRVTVFAGSSSGGVCDVVIRVNGQFAYYQQTYGLGFHRVSCIGIGVQNCPCLNENSSLGGIHQIGIIDVSSPVTISVHASTTSAVPVQVSLMAMVVEYTTK